MTLCRLMVDDFRGILEDITPKEAYDEYDLHFGITYCDGWMKEGRTKDLIDGFNLKKFRAWCERKLEERAES